jgi:alpha-beta hydrolase superfamily lysophospholipase
MSEPATVDTGAPATRPWRRRLLRWSVWTVAALALIVATVIVGGAVDARRRLPDLQPWHRYSPTSEVRAAEIDDRFTIADYFAREDRIFDEVRTHVEDVLPPAGADTANRYVRASQSSPSRLDRNYNRSYEVVPETIRGGALLVHGLTDSPYSMRAIAEQLKADGYYSLALRIPGHGTVPAGLVSSGADDWHAAVRLGVRHVRSRIADGRPLVLVGYSNGGALVARYALDALEDSSLPRPDRLVLVSPMIGVSPAARLARVISALGPIPYFEKARWLDVIPEYNPVKYNSFPANAAQQTFVVTRDLQQRLGRLGADGRLANFPPVLTFQSLVDATVSTPAIVANLYDRLPKNGSALVLFDFNRLARLDPFIRPEDHALIPRLFGGRARNYRVTVITNARTDTRDAQARDVEPGSTTPIDESIGLQWEPDTFSLSHVALPFPPDDPVYGSRAAASPTGPVALGLLTPRGERSVLTVPVEVLMRVSSNPFFPYLAQRLSGWVNTGR